MYKRAERQKKYFFSKRLRGKLEKIPHYPLTVVEAPSGFGKTTAIREFLSHRTSSDVNAYWYTCLGEPALAAWYGICELLARVNVPVASELKNFETPTMETLHHIAAVLREAECNCETYLVLDNYQLFNCEVPLELISVLSMHRSPKLHIIIITQKLGTRQQRPICGGEILAIGPSAFAFDKAGTADLFRMEGIHLPEAELEAVFSHTEGWVSAIRLQIINYKECGYFHLSSSIEHLVEAAIWSKLSQQEKDFLLSVSVLGSFTPAQAAIMMNLTDLPENIENLLRQNDFIRYHPDKGIYVIHSILQDYLRNRFYFYRPEEFQKQIFRLAGKSYVAVGQYFTAAQYFYQVGDFDAILSIPFSCEYLTNQKENSLPEFIVSLVEDCPEETLCNYPFVLSTFASQLFLCGRYDTYRKLCGLIRRVIAGRRNLNPYELGRLRGLFTLVQSMEAYNDIRQMGEYFAASREVLDQYSEYRRHDTPVTLGCTSVLFMFWREPGELERELENIRAFLSQYRRLMRGHGAGADSVMRAEALLMRGKDNEAEIFCYKALYAAQSQQEDSICLCAGLVLARIAILRGDSDGYQTAIRHIRSYQDTGYDLPIRRMAELCMTVVSLILGVMDYVPSWMCSMEMIEKTLYAPVIPYAQTLYSMMLLMKKQYNKLFGLSKYIMETAGNTTENMRYLMLKVSLFKSLAVAKHRIGEEREAQEYFNKALSLAMSDQVYLPFAQRIKEMGPLFSAAEGSVISRDTLNTITALGRRQERGVSAIKRVIFPPHSTLTPREREIADLARARLSAREIANKLYISEATVKTILKSVYSKLEVHSKSELIARDF